ncbi:MAG: pyridoxal-phosphate dependent enzyme [Cellvibrionaceae bacterium]|nr:pyridoxal-phosphate dependent enzyme [Cellvibrionaceae bacterium]MCV6624668.1 pyridoxal-phosphate dependent enzyme [Cellvibrionaceae bacterium]
MNYPLFSAFPGLEEKVPVVAIAKLPTPVEPATQLAPNLWIKRDDKTNTLYGGNKVRKLDFVLADFFRSGKKKLVTMGGIGTNHGVATAIYGLQMDIPVEIYLFEQPLSPYVQRNLKLMHRFNAKLNYRGGLFNTALQFYWDKLIHSNNTYHLPAGGSNLAGCIAFVNAAFELRQQVQAGLSPEPDTIFCPVGSSATLAGLSLGCRLAGLKTRTVGVRVAPSHLGPLPICTEATITKLQADCYRYLCRLDPSLKGVELPTVELQHNFYGKGYGHPSTDGEWAQQMFKHTKLKLEPTYTAKAAAGVLNYCANHSDKTVLYWHTANSAEVDELAAKADCSSLPEALLKFMKNPLD